MKKIGVKILFVIGLLIFLFPFVMRTISYFNQTTAIYNYKSTTESLSEDELNEQKNHYNKYNEELADENPIVEMSEDDFNVDETQSTYDFLNSDDAIGSLIIPSINVNLPIFDGVTNLNLQKGIAHLDNTSYPTGEKSTHCVLAGHSGLSRAKILDDLDKVQIGDYFQIDYLNTTHNYVVVDIQIVLPEETESLRIKQDDTLVTLVTCTPKNINSHRLLVTGRLTDMIPQDETLSTLDYIVQFIKLNYIYVILFIIFVICLIIFLKERKKDKKVKNKDNKIKENKKKEDIKNKEKENNINKE